MFRVLSRPWLSWVPGNNYGQGLACTSHIQTWSHTEYNQDCEYFEYIRINKYIKYIEQHIYQIYRLTSNISPAFKYMHIREYDVPIVLHYSQKNKKKNKKKKNGITPGSYIGKNFSQFQNFHQNSWRRLQRKCKWSKTSKQYLHLKI